MTLFYVAVKGGSYEDCIDSVMRCICSSGGISFVLNSGNHWMHNIKGGSDWFVQLSGWWYNGVGLSN